MKKLFLFLLLLCTKLVSAQCNYVWAQWTDQGMTDTAYATLSVNGAPLGMTMTANFDFDFTPAIFNYATFSPYPNLPVNSTAPRTTWALGAGGQTTMCFSQPVVNPVLLLASIGNFTTPVTLTFSNSYNVLFDGGGNVYTNTTTIDALEGFCIIEFPGTFTCVSIFSSTPEFYTNLTWGVKNPLTAGFTFANQCHNNSVSFSSATSFVNAPGSIIAYDWNFGDGTVDTAQNPLHSFPATGTYNVQLVITSNSFCRDTFNTLVTVNPSYSINNPVSLCGGQTYTINSHTYSTSGTFYDTLTTSLGCDSIIITQLNVSQAVNTINPQTICSGGSYSFNSHVYTIPGNYYDTLATISGCDSVVITQLNVNPAYQANNPISVCPGGSYIFNAHTYNLAGVYYDTLLTAAGCDSIVITTLTINPLPLITFNHPADVCINTPSFTLNHASPYGGIYSGTAVVNNSFDPLTANVGIHQLNYSYTDPGTGCTNTAQENITVHPEPVAQLSVTPTNAQLVNPRISFIDLTQGSSHSQWNFGDNGISDDNSGFHIYNDTGHFRVSLIVTDAFGCTDTAYETVFIEGEFEFYVPNAFTPNGDGINDNFSGTGVGVEEYLMKIFDRWGKEIFETNDITRPWNGKNVPGDTYVYKINLSDVFGTEHEFVGKVSVVR